MTPDPNPRTLTLDPLIQPHTKPNVRIFGAPPIVAAQYKGFDSIVEILLSANADVNKPNSYGYTALHLEAFTWGKPAAVMSL